MFRSPLLGLCVVFAAVGPAAAGDVKPMLEDWVQDFQQDPFAETAVTFGVRVKDAEPSDWHVVVSGEQDEAGHWGVTLAEGMPGEPSAFYVTDTETLGKLHAGEWASLTSMGKAFSTDFAPMDIDVMEGFVPTGEAMGHLIKLSFHFWTRGMPEIVRFGNDANTRELHGANATLFYYQPGFRSGWFSIAKGQHVNADEASQTNPFPSLFVITRGSAQARIGGVERTIREGEAIYIGPGVSHEFWNEGDEAAEGILTMFGEGA